MIASKVKIEVIMKVNILHIKRIYIRKLLKNKKILLIVIIRKMKLIYMELIAVINEFYFKSILLKINLFIKF